MNGKQLLHYLAQSAGSIHSHTHCCLSTVINNYKKERLAFLLFSRLAAIISDLSRPHTWLCLPWLGKTSIICSQLSLPSPSLNTLCHPIPVHQTMDHSGPFAPLSHGRPPPTFLRCVLTRGASSARAPPGSGGTVPSLPCAHVRGVTAHPPAGRRQQALASAQHCVIGWVDGSFRLGLSN